MKLNPSRLCGPNISLYVSLCFAFLVLSTSIILVYHFRWVIRYRLSVTRLSMLDYKNNNEEYQPDHFEYDINVLFTSDEDTVWVRDHLHPFLLDIHPHFQRIAYGDDDLILGLHYLDAVEHLVITSFKSIILLSRTAVLDNWFLIKCRMAMDHGKDTQIENTVLIFLEDIPDRELPNLVRIYLKDRRPYIRWRDDATAQKYFWDMLSKHLTMSLVFNLVIQVR